MRQIVLDTETTGLKIEDGHKIIEIGCIEVINRKITGKRFHHYLNPEREIEQGALAVHGITQEFLHDKPKFVDVIDGLIDFISGSELIIHNAPFDLGFLDYEFKLTAKKLPLLSRTCRITDTLVLARQLHVGQRNSLDALCKRYGIDNTQRELHGALLDAHLLAQVYLAMTGGQSSLFESPTDKIVATAATRTLVDIPQQKRNLVVLKASPEELKLHDEKLAKMREKGKCLWG